MKTLKIDTSKVSGAVTPAEIAALKSAAEEANALLYSKKGAGNDFLGWVNLPSSIDAAQLADIQATAQALRAKAEVIVAIGIGGSYLGAKAVLEAMSDSFSLLKHKKGEPIVVFAGQNISEDYLSELLDALKDRSIAAIVISKSGTTTEPAIAFRILKSEIEARYGKAKPPRGS